MAQTPDKKTYVEIPFIEQLKKNSRVDRFIKQYLGIVETINTQIVKLKELRKTLINDVVTGKIGNFSKSPGMSCVSGLRANISL